jgi:hypothetical protein
MKKEHKNECQNCLGSSMVERRSEVSEKEVRFLSETM